MKVDKSLWLAPFLLVVLMLYCIDAMAQTVPSQLSGLSTSTDRFDPYTLPPRPLAGAKYIDTYHPNGTGNVELQRLPDIPSNCTVRTWQTSFNVMPYFPVYYSGKYYHVPYSANAMTSPIFAKVTNASSAAGTNVLYFASTAATASFLNGLISGIDYTVSGNAAIPTGTTVSSFTLTSVTLSANLTGTGVASGASISFVTYPTQAPFVEITQAEACADMQTAVAYSSRQSFNSDGSRFLILVRGMSNTLALYRTNPLSFEKFITNPMMSLGNASETWSTTDPDIIYYFDSLSGSTFRQMNVETGVVTTLYTFKTDGTECDSGYTVVQNGGSGNPSADQRYWPAFCKNGSTGAQGTILVYDKVLNTVSSRASIGTLCGGGSHSIDIMTMSPSGLYAIVSWSYAEGPENVWSTCHGAELFDRTTLASRGMVFSYGSGHLDVGYDVNGREVAVTTLNGHKWILGENIGTLNAFTPLAEVRPPPYSLATSYVRRMRYPCTLYRQQVTSDPYTGCGSTVLPGTPTSHISGRGAQDPANGGWFMMSIVSEGGPIGTEAPGWGKSENIAFRVDSNVTAQYTNAVFRRVSRNLSARLNQVDRRCTTGTDYWQEAHTTTNRDFTKLMFTSNWLSQCGKTSVFLVDLPTQAQQVETLTVSANRRGESAVITFGRPLLPMSTSCTVTALNGSTTVATLTSPTGRATRQVGFSELPSVNLTFSVACGTEIGSVSTLATPALTGTADVPITRVGAFTVNYGPTLASSVSGTGSVTLSAQPLGVLVPFQICGPHCGVVQYYIP